MTNSHLITRRYTGLCRILLIASFSIGLVSVSGSSNAQNSLHSQRQPTSGQPWDFKYTNQAGMFTFYDTPAGTSATGKPLDIGDFDHNGCGDLAVTGQQATFRTDSGYRTNAGDVRIIMNVCPIQGKIALEDNVPPIHTIRTIYGERSGDMAGTETYVGDFNGDGYDDLALSAQNNDGVNTDRSNAGAVYVILGGPNFASGGDIDLRNPPDNVLKFYGAATQDRFGIWVDGGDFDKDGYKDLLIGANQADGAGNHRPNSGEAWIIWGAPDMRGKYGAVTDIGFPPADATRILGVDPDDLLGSTVWGGDVNGDGYDDAIVSAALWRGSAGVGGLSFGGGDGPGNHRFNAGETYVIFGNPGLRGQTIDLAAHINPDTGAPTDNSITVIYGPDPNDVLGEEITTGDLDGDGRNDLVLGSLVGDGWDNNHQDTGEAWVIYAHEPFEGQMFDLAHPEPGRTVVVYPDQADSKGGDTLRVADLDSDGIGDLFLGAPDYDPTGYDGQVRRDAGMLAILFGEKGGLPNNNGHIILPSAPPTGLRVRYLIGADANDMMSYSFAVGDVNGDGVLDIAPNAMGGDGEYNTQHNAGEIYLISGAEFLSSSHNFQPEATAAAASPTPEPTVNPTPTSAVVTSLPGDAARGQALFAETCAGCHGPQAVGGGVGPSLVTSDFVLDSTDDQLVHFLEVGRSGDDPNNETGMTMPAYGGRTDWGEAELRDVVAYLRSLTNR